MIHSNAQCLNLVILSFVRIIGRASSYFGILQRIYAFISQSTVNKFFTDWLREAKVEFNGTEVEMFKLTLKRLSDTRWTCQYDACKAIHVSFKYILGTLEHFSVEYQNGESRAGAERLLNEVTKEFAIYLVIFKQVLMLTMILSKDLQGESMDLAAEIQHINGVQAQLDMAIQDTVSELSLCKYIWNTATLLIPEFELPQQVFRPFRQSRLLNETLPGNAVTEVDDISIVFIPLVTRIVDEF